MKKNRFLGLLISTAVIQLLFCGGAFAKNVYKAIALKPNVSVTQRKNDTKKTDDGTSRTVYYYKAAAPFEGYFTVTVKKGTSKNNAQLKVFAKPGSKAICIDDNEETIVRRFPVSKGALYFRAGSGNTIKYQFTKVIQRGNYCAGKALPLKRGKKAVVCQTPEYHFRRWFKIYLPKKQPITLWYDNDFCHIWIDDERLKDVDTTEVSGSDKKWYSISTKTMPKGTYYIEVMMPVHLDYGDDDLGYFVDTLYWK